MPKCCTQSCQNKHLLTYRSQSKPPFTSWEKGPSYGFRPLSANIHRKTEEASSAYRLCYPETAPIYNIGFIKYVKASETLQGLQELEKWRALTIKSVNAFKTGLKVN